MWGSKSSQVVETIKVDYLRSIPETPRSQQKEPDPAGQACWRGDAPWRAWRERKRRSGPSRSQRRGLRKPSCLRLSHSRVSRPMALYFSRTSRRPVGLPRLVLPPAFFRLSFEDTISSVTEAMVFEWIRCAADQVEVVWLRDFDGNSWLMVIVMIGDGVLMMWSK